MRGGWHAPFLKDQLPALVSQAPVEIQAREPPEARLLVVVVATRRLQRRLASFTVAQQRQLSALRPKDGGGEVLARHVPGGGPVGVVGQYSNDWLVVDAGQLLGTL